MTTFISNTSFISLLTFFLFSALFYTYFLIYKPKYILDSDLVFSKRLSLIYSVLYSSIIGLIVILFGYIFLLTNK